MSFLNPTTNTTRPTSENTAEKRSALAQRSNTVDDALRGSARSYSSFRCESTALREDIAELERTHKVGAYEAHRLSRKLDQLDTMLDAVNTALTDGNAAKSAVIAARAGTDLSAWENAVIAAERAAELLKQEIDAAQPGLERLRDSVDRAMADNPAETTPAPGTAPTGTGSVDAKFRAMQLLASYQSHSPRPSLKDEDGKPIHFFMKVTRGGTDRYMKVDPSTVDPDLRAELLPGRMENKKFISCESFFGQVALELIKLDSSNSLF